MKSWLIPIAGAIISVLIIFFFLFSSSSDTREYAIFVEIEEQYPSEFLPISEWELLGMPKLIYAMNETRMQHILNEQDWLEIYDFLEATEGIIEFAGDFYYIQLLRI
jgi:hypothetical protein